MVLSYEAVCFDLFGTLVTGDGAPIAGAYAALHALPPERWAIVTSCGSGFATALIADAGLPAPGVLVTADDVASGKPAPDPYRLAVQRLGVLSAQAIAIEDSREGIVSARAAGLDVIGIARGRGLPFAVGAIAHVDRFEEIRWSVGPEGAIGVDVSGR